MKQGYRYTIIFTLIVSLVFTLVLAVANTLLKPRIDANAELAEQRAIMDSLGMDKEGEAAQIQQRFNESVEMGEAKSFHYYRQVNSSGETEGYAIPFVGSGLWGSIHGYLGVTPGLDQMKGIVFTSQNETPGLGGRIEEDWFREQFRGVEIPADALMEYGAQTSGQNVDAISGATQTSNAVIRIINQVIADQLPEMEGVK